MSAAISNAARDLAAKRGPAPHTSMLLRMMLRAAILRRGRAASALLAMVVAAAVATAMLNLYVDVEAKLEREFRNYGANIILVGKNNDSLPADALRQVDSILAGRGMAAPFAFVVARTSDGQPIVVAGADFNRVRQLNQWWSVSRWPAEIPTLARKDGDTMASPKSQAQHPALVGVRAVPVVSPNHEPFTLEFHGRTLQVFPQATVQTGAAEDSRIYLPLDAFEAWTGVRTSTIEVGATGSPDEVNRIMNQLAQSIPAADVKPVRQIMEGEARVLGKTRGTVLAASALIVLTAALCVLSTLMGWVLDRRRDFAIMKALGASGRILNGFFAAEAAAMGATGAVLGFVVGIGIAAWIGRVNFHAAVVPRLSVFPVVLVGGTVVTLVSAILPISLLGRVQPAVILRGE